MERKVNSDLLKGLAIIAVVAIHSFSKDIGTSGVYLFVDQASRFTVPMFVALSGFGLAMSFAKNNNLIHFYFKRALKLLPWFLFASVLILIYKGGYDFLNYHTWTMIMRGQADYHLYFVPMIFRLYLIFPLLYYLTNKRPGLMLILALILQIVWYEYSRGWLDQMQYLRPETWIFYFILGIYLAKKPLTPRPYPLIILVVGLILTFAHAYLLQQSGTDLLWATRFTRLPVILYATGFILFGLTSNPYPLAPVLSILGKYSYQIYLLHTLVLRLVPALNPFLLTPLVLLLTLVFVKFILISINVFTRSATIFLRRS